MHLNNLQTEPHVPAVNHLGRVPLGLISEGDDEHMLEQDLDVPEHHQPEHVHHVSIPELHHAPEIVAQLQEEHPVEMGARMHFQAGFGARLRGSLQEEPQEEEVIEEEEKEEDVVEEAMRELGEEMDKAEAEEEEDFGQHLIEQNEDAYEQLMERVIEETVEFRRQQEE